ncbi:hypothetical protein WDW89_08575 [Deltaproteobacteria bacterium TL4]
MYSFNIVKSFPHSIDETFIATSRDFDPLADYIPDLSKIETLEHEKLGEGRHRWLVRFHAEAGLPKIVRPIVKPEMLRWNEVLICDQNKKTIEWEVITDYFTEYVHCKGVTYYHETPNGTDIDLQGGFSITLERIPGIPSVIVKKAVQILEPFIGKLIEPNMTGFYEAAIERLESLRNASTETPS